MSRLVQRRADSWRAQWALAAAAESAARVGGSAVLALTACVWADRLAGLPQPARWALWAAAVAGLALAIFFWAWRPFSRFEWGAVLDAAARAYPEAREGLKAAWELSRRAPGPGVSAALAQAHVERTEALLRGLPERAVFPARPSAFGRKATAAALAAALTWWPLRASPSWVRVLAPWRDVPLERYLTVSPGDVRPALGAPALIRAQWPGASPVAAQSGSLTLWLRGTDGWRAASWDGRDAQSASYGVEALTAPLDYRLSWRGLRTRVYHISPVILPELDSLRVTLESPQPQTSALSAAEPFSALRGSWLTVTGTPNQALAKAYARLSSWPVPLPMKRLRSGDWQVSFPLRDDAELSFQLEGEAGARDPHPASYQLKAVADQPPRIDLLSPTQPLAASPRDSIPITYSASDDGGLTRISLIVWPAGKPRQETVVELPGGRREAAGDASLDLFEMPLGRLQFQLEALDDAHPSQAGFSAKGVIDVVDLDAGHAKTQASWLKAEDALKNLSDRESQARALAAARSPELAAERAELERAFQGAAQDLRELAAQMDADPYANPGVAQEARTSAQGLAQAAARPLPAAEDAARRGDFEGARAAHERLQRQVDAARRMLEDGRKLQGLQDVFSQTGRMSQSAQSLQSALEAPAAMGKRPSPEQLARLQRSLSRLRKQLDAMVQALSKLPKASAGAARGKVYQLPLQDAKESADALAKALASGDYAKAARLAERLADQLEQAQRGLAQAAADAASSGQDSEAQRQLSLAQGQWSELVDDQTRVIARTQKLEDDRVARTLSAQRDLLAELEKRQAAAVWSAAALGQSFPQDALGAMRMIQGEFAARRVAHSVQLLAAVSDRLRAEPGPAARRLEPLAVEEDAIREKLEGGAQAQAPPQQSRGAAQEQAAVRRKTGGLEQRLEAMDPQVPQAALQGLEGAQGRQKDAEGALGGGDSASALSSEQKALQLLEQGAQQLSQAAGQRLQSQAAMSFPFQGGGMPGGSSSGSGAGGRSGAQMTFVPLPSARDYRPAPEIRKELEKSLQEPRPASFDGLIRDYFKRIAQ